jgi:tRNA 2-thiouridine synthesizing protein E
MTYEVDGRSIEADGNGYLVNQEDWDEQVAQAIAAADGIPALTQDHWDVINYLRGEYFNNGQHQPNMRALLKGMSEAWSRKIDSKALYDLFPMGPHKQAAKVAGLPETKGKAGY